LIKDGNVLLWLQAIARLRMVSQGDTASTRRRPASVSFASSPYQMDVDDHASLDEEMNEAGSNFRPAHECDMTGEQ